MNLTRSERISASASIGVMGKSAVGKEELSVHYLAPALEMMVVNTGRSVRGAALMAYETGKLEEGRGNTWRLKSGAERMIQYWAMAEGRRGLHFVVSPPDRSTRIYFGNTDLTDAIRPRAEGFTSQRVLEKVAALIASDPTIRKGLHDLWRRTALELGGAIMVTKRIDDYLPEAHAKYHLLVTDPKVSAGYRVARGISATSSFEDEIAYLRARDLTHQQNGLDVVPKDALHIDMTELLLRKGGMQRAAGVVLADLEAKSKVVFNR